MIGHIDGSAETTTRAFDIVLDEEASLELDDLVIARSDGPAGTVAHYAIVTECESRLEGASFPSDTLRIAGTKTMPGALSRTARVTVLRVDPERWVSPRAGAAVELAVGAERERALFVDQMENAKRLAVGFDRRLEPVYVDFSFINGEKGGHVSISGISGVATKTSYALFLLYQIFETARRRELLGDHGINARALVFNVKGEDLLHLDRPNVKFGAHPDAAAQWRAVGVEAPGVFKSVSLFAPIANSDEGSKGTDVTSRGISEVKAFGWTPYTFIRSGLLRFAFTDARDARTQISYVEESVRLQLLRWAHPCASRPGAAVMIDPSKESIPRTWDAAFGKHRLPRESGEGRLITNFSHLIEFVDEKLDVEPGTAQAIEWGGRTQGNSVAAFLRRLFAVGRRLGHLVRINVDPFALAADVNVVDLHTLHDDAQRFIVGALLDEIFEQKQKLGREPLRFIVLDELNKYAPKNDSSPIKDLLVDIAARGRSLGVILIGAQQSAANVDPAIIENAAVKIVGRLDASSAETYRFLGPELRERATRFLPGTMIVDQPLVPAPIPLRFPFPSYATNQNDARDDRAVAPPDVLQARSRELM